MKEKSGFHAARRCNVCLLVLACLSLSTVFGYAQNSDNSDIPLAKTIDSILDAPAFHTAFEGVFIQRLRDRRVLYERNADRVFLPASNNKILTSLAALVELGPTYTYHTTLLAAGHLTRDGVLHGNLIIKGSGDPTLTDADLQKMAEEARKQGLRRVLGTLLYDDSLFDRQWLGDVWAWDDEPYYYSAEISALNVDGNLITVHLMPGKKVGAPVRVEISPIANYVRVENLGVTGPSKSQNTLFCTRLEGRNVLLITGQLPRDIKSSDEPTVQLTIVDPARYTATILLNDLQKEGIHFDHTRLVDISQEPNDAVTLADHTSAPLSTILRLMNKPSNNLIAECLLKTVGAKATGKGTGGIDGSAVQTARHIFQQAGLIMDEIRQADGSGLSRINFVSPHDLVLALSYLAEQPYFDVFYDSLPIAGVDGSLYYRMKGTAAAENCHAKTGYVSQVNTLSGYVTDKDGDRIVFSIMFNNCLAPYSTCTAAQDQIVETLANWSDTKTALKRP